MRITRILSFLYAALFAVLGLAFWAQPERAAARFGLDAVGSTGFGTLRGDLGGLFVALSVLCLVGVLARRAPALLAAAGVLAAIVVGRLVNLALHGAGGPPANLLVELGGVVVLGLEARALIASSAGRASLRRGLLVAGGLVLAIGAIFALLLAPPVQNAVFARMARQQIALSRADLLKDDALRVGICGTSAPLPSHDRAKACVAVFAGGKFYVVDAGPESVENLMQWKIPLGQVGGVLLTHFHSDHIGDLGELNLQTWAAGRPAPLAVYGGPGVDQVVAGFNQAYAVDQGYRTAHHGPAMMPAATWPMQARQVDLAGPPTPAMSRTAVVLDDGKLRITAIEVDHGPVHPAYAYRFDYKGRSVVVTGDTANHPPLAVAAKGADVMVSEAIARPMIRTLETTAREVGNDRVAHIMHDIQGYHISPQEAAGLANQAGVKLLVFYHLLPAPDNALTKHMFVQGVAQARHGDWVMADDGSLYTLPLGSTEVRIGRVDR